MRFGSPVVVWTPFSVLSIHMFTDLSVACCLIVLWDVVSAVLVVLTTFDM